MKQTLCDVCKSVVRFHNPYVQVEPEFPLRVQSEKYRFVVEAYSFAPFDICPECLRQAFIKDMVEHFGGNAFRKILQDMR